MTTGTPTSAFRYDRYDVDTDNDADPTWRRLQDEAPRYRNDEHGFGAISRWDDVRPALFDWDTYRSGRGTVLLALEPDCRVPVRLEGPRLRDRPL